PRFTLAAITAREDPRDALVSNRFRALADMPPSSVVGTSSLRRAEQVSERYRRLDVRLLRGNVETRIAKLDCGDYDAIVLAVAGLVRLGLAARISARLPVDESLPAPGQGALGIECRGARAEVVALLAPLADPDTARCVYAERAVSRALGGRDPAARAAARALPLARLRPRHLHQPFRCPRRIGGAAALAPAARRGDRLGHAP